MAAFRIDLIGRYLRPHRRTVLFGAVALVIVNVLSVTIPLEVRRIIDELQGGFAVSDVLRQAGWIVLLASTMAVVRLISRQLVFGVGRRWRWICARSCLSGCSSRNRAGCNRPAAAK